MSTPTRFFPSDILSVLTRRSRRGGSVILRVGARPVRLRVLPGKRDIGRNCRPTFRFTLAWGALIEAPRARDRGSPVADRAALTHAAPQRSTPGPAHGLLAL